MSPTVGNVIGLVLVFVIQGGPGCQGPLLRPAIGVVRAVGAVGHPPALAGVLACLSHLLQGHWPLPRLTTSGTTSPGVFHTGLGSCTARLVGHASEQGSSLANHQVAGSGLVLRGYAVGLVWVLWAQSINRLVVWALVRPVCLVFSSSISSTLGLVVPGQVKPSPVAGWQVLVRWPGFSFLPRSPH